MYQQIVASKRVMTSIFCVAVATFFAFMGGKLFSAEAAPAATFVVNVAADAAEAPFIPDGICDVDVATPGQQCTLRAAIEETNALPGPDDILLNVPTIGAGVVTIAVNPLLGALPALTDPGGVLIDAASQPGTVCAPTSSDVHSLKVVLDGSAFAPATLADGLAISAASSGNVIRGLAIVNFPNHGLSIGGGGGNMVVCTHIGVGVDGISPQANKSNGLMITNSASNSIGTDLAQDRNVISANGGDGIMIVGGGATDNNIVGNRIGTSADGAAPLGNRSNGVRMLGSATSNTIGGDSSSGFATGCTDTCNLISGNGIHGVQIAGAANSNSVFGNFIGSNGAGDLPLANGANGVHLQGVSSITLGDSMTTSGNLISGNGGSGVVVLTLPSSPVTATGNSIQNNYIGLAADGINDLQNSANGVRIVASENTNVEENRIAHNDSDGIYGENVEDLAVLTNIIKRNGGSGIYLLGSETGLIGRNSRGNLIHSNIAHGIVISGTGSRFNIVLSNWIGLQADGTTAAGNGGDGILIQDAQQSNIGSSYSDSIADDLANIIVDSGGSGIRISGSSAVTNSIDHNFIGTTILTPTLELGNTDYGILLENGASGNLAGILGGVTRGSGPTEASSNTIAFNGKDGIAVIGSSTSNGFTNNLIYDNGELGIDLADDGVTANDVDGSSSNDSDSGANDLQNYPDLTAGSLSSILVELRSTAGVTYTINLFTSDSCEPSGYGEGEVWQDSFDLNVPGGGFVRQSYAFTSTLAGQYATATATNADGSTSEFSACVQISNNIVVNDNDDADDGSCDAEHCSLREAIDAVNNGKGDTIEFAISGTGPHAIEIESELPWMTRPVTIDGTTQDGASCPSADEAATLMIELDGSLAGAANGLVLHGGSSMVQGLAIHSFEVRGISMGINGGNTIRCNHIGTNASGTSDGFDNGSDGVQMSNISNNVIGGSSPADRNVIVNSNDPSSSRAMGVRITNGGDNTVANNCIGVNASGTVALGNEAAGIYLDSSSAQISDNVISGNLGHGIHILDGATATVEGNLIGLGSDGSTALGNGEDGIHVWNSFNNFIGTSDLLGRGAALPNTIANNVDNGVVVRQSGSFTSTNNLILSNSIFDNGDLGIDLGNDGITLNDADDVDTGANNLINFPVLGTAIDAGSAANVSVELDMASSGDYIVEFFSNTSCDGTHGEGKTVVATEVLSADSNGDLSTILSLSGAAVGDFLTATATDLTGNSSEFSACVEVAEELVVNSSNDVDDGVCNSSHCSLREAINAVNSGFTENVSFAIAGSGPHVIQPASALPVVTERITLDGTTQASTSCPTSGSTPALQIVLDGSLSGAVPGLEIEGGGDISGLAIHSFGEEGIYATTSDFLTIECMHIGTDGTGLTAGLGNGAHGIRVSNIQVARIGGHGPDDGNVIVSNLESGGGVARGVIFQSGGGHSVIGNLIGIGADGVTTLGNEGNGVYMSGTEQVFISDNVIGANAMEGIYGINVTQVAVFGNSIGISADLTTNLANGGDGIEFVGASASVVGFTDDFTRGEEIMIVPTNTIAFNGGHGIHLRTTVSLTTTEVLAANNSIYSNSLTGINLNSSGSGVTENDAGDSDSGANDLLNFPEISSVALDGTTMTISATLNTVASQPVDIYLFASDNCDGSGNGEGQRPLGKLETVTDASGNATFSGSLAVGTAVDYGDTITALTVVIGEDVAISSEFSDCYALTVPTVVGLGAAGVVSAEIALILTLFISLITATYISKRTIIH